MRISNYSRDLPIDFGTLFDIYTYSPFQKVQQKIYAFGYLSCPIARAFDCGYHFEEAHSCDEWHQMTYWCVMLLYSRRIIAVLSMDFCQRELLRDWPFVNRGQPILGRLASTRCRISAIGQLMWVDEFIEGVRKQFGDSGNINLRPIISQTVLHQRFGRDEVRQQIVGTRSLCSLLYGLFGLEMIQLAIFLNTWNIWRLYDRVPFILSHEFEVVPAGWMIHCPFFDFGGKGNWPKTGIHKGDCRGSGTPRVQLHARSHGWSWESDLIACRGGFLQSCHLLCDWL
jgi:hypothetical protein